MSLSPIPASRPDRVWLARAVALVVLSVGASAVTAIAPALVTMAHSSEDDEQTRSDEEAEQLADEAEERAKEAEELAEEAKERAEAEQRDPEHVAAPAGRAQAPAPTVTLDAAALVPAHPVAQSIKAGTTTATKTTRTPDSSRVAAAAPPGPQSDRAPVQKPSTPISSPQAALPNLALAAAPSPARQGEGQVASAAPSIAGETVGRVLYAGGAGLLLLLALYGAAYRGARSLRLP